MRSPALEFGAVYCTRGAKLRPFRDGGWLAGDDGFGRKIFRPYLVGLTKFQFPFHFVPFRTVVGDGAAPFVSFDTPLRQAQGERMKAGWSGTNN